MPQRVAVQKENGRFECAAQAVVFDGDCDTRAVRQRQRDRHAVAVARAEPDALCPAPCTTPSEDRISEISCSSLRR
jgi:hypothetical protein